MNQDEGIYITPLDDMLLLAEKCDFQTECQHTFLVVMDSSCSGCYYSLGLNLAALTFQVVFSIQTSACQNICSCNIKQVSLNIKNESRHC